MPLFCKVLDEHLLQSSSIISVRSIRYGDDEMKHGRKVTNRSHRNSKRSVGRALHDIIVELDDLLYPRHWRKKRSVSLLYLDYLTGDATHWEERSGR